jgi:AraC family transcriptional regulator
MPRQKTITNNIGLELYSVEIYQPNFFNNFDPAAVFEKWAAVEVKNFDVVPDHMESLIIPSGLYAVFVHKGPASEGPKTYQYILGTWLPKAEFLLDNRPHFALMGEKYKNNDPTSEEELWIPIKSKE